jgi:hypothetical protein
MGTVCAALREPTNRSQLSPNRVCRSDLRVAGEKQTGGLQKKKRVADSQAVSSNDR